MRAAEGEVRILISSAKIKRGLNLHAKTCDFYWQGAESSPRPAEASSRSKHKLTCWHNTEALRVENSGECFCSVDFDTGQVRRCSGAVPVPTR